MPRVTGLKELMATLSAFVLLEFEGHSIWEARSGDAEILVALMPEGDVLVSRTVEGTPPLAVSFSRFDPGLEGLLRSWLGVSVQ